MNVFGRAELQRTVVLVVALLVTGGSTDAPAREFRASDAQSEDYPTVQTPFEAAMTGIYARAQRDPASERLLERIRKVE